MFSEFNQLRSTTQYVAYRFKTYQLKREWFYSKRKHFDLELLICLGMGTNKCAWMHKRGMHGTCPQVNYSTGWGIRPIWLKIVLFYLLISSSRTACNVHWRVRGLKHLSSTSKQKMINTMKAD